MRRKLTICLVLAALTLGVYWPARHNGFLLYDDHVFVTQNLVVQAGLTWSGLRYAFTTAISNNWHPVTTLSHMLDCAVFGVNAGPQHVVSVALHAANALLLFLLLQRLTGALWRSAIVAAFFALHPLRVESVAWIAERKDVLGGFFFLLTLLAYVRYSQGAASPKERKPVKDKKSLRAVDKVAQASLPAGSGGVPPPGPESTPGGTPRELAGGTPAPHFVSGPEKSAAASCPAFAARPWTRYYNLALLFFVLGLMSKPMLVTLPFALLLLDFWPLQRLNASPLRHSLIPILRLVREKWPFFTLSAASCLITLRTQGLNSGMATLSQVSLGDRVANAITSYVEYLAKMFWPTRLAVIYPHPGRHYPVSDAWPAWQVWAGGLLLLAISAFCLCQLRRRPWLAVGWFWYLGTMVPVIGLVQVGHQAMADRYTYIPLMGPAISLVWLVSELWRPGIARQLSLATVGLASLAVCLVLTHRQLEYWRDTVSLAQHTLEITADNPAAQSLLGIGLVEEGRISMGAVYFRSALAIDPRFALAHLNLGSALTSLKLLPQAADEYLAATRLEPWDYPAHLALVAILTRSGQIKEAVPRMEEAWRIYQEQNLGTPNSLAAQQTTACLYRLAWALATSDRAEDRNGGQAIRFAERACELTQYRQALLVGGLAAAYAEAGQFPRAVATAEQACALVSASGDQTLRKRNQELLEWCRSGKPYREPAQPAPP